MPTLKELKQAGVEPEESFKTEKVLTGIALIKDLKRQREVDDIFAMMNEDDSFKNQNKRQKTAPTLTVPVSQPKPITQV